jgi:hypothetical protein
MKTLTVITVLLFVVGCCPVNDMFVKSVDSAWEVIGPEYIQYVETDDTLDDDTKTIRKRTATMLTEMIKEAQDAR